MGERAHWPCFRHRNKTPKNVNKMVAIYSNSFRLVQTSMHRTNSTNSITSFQSDEKNMMPWQICFQFQFKRKEIPIPIRPSMPKTNYMNAKCIHNATIGSSNCQNPNTFSSYESYENYDQVMKVISFDQNMLKPC